MKTSSAKAKGRRAAVEVKELLHQWAPDLKPDDIRVTPSGVMGEDIQFSPAARAIYPYVIECKNVEKLNVHEALAQAMSHIKEIQDVFPILFFRKNRSELFVALRASDFMRLTR